MRSLRNIVAAGVLSLVMAVTALAAESMRVLFITGADGHPWRENMEIIAGHLEAWDITNIDRKIVGGPDEWADWEGDYRDYDVIVVMYYQPRAGEESLEKLEAYVREGGGLVGLHSGIAGFNGQELYDNMIGMGWRGANYGKSLMMTEDFEPIVREAGEGRGSAHPPIQEFAVQTIDREHPITRRLPEVWMQSRDELYYNMRGPINDIHVLATANRDVPGGENAPQLWVHQYGEGRVFVTTLGHYQPSVDSVGFMTTLAFGMEWAATGDVTLPMPANFPTAEESSRGTPEFE